MATLLVAQTPAVEQAVPRPIDPEFHVPVVPAFESRLALSPSLDGQIQPEEWEEFSADERVQSWFQWEPSKLHAAAKLPVGSDLLLSLDLRADGWLVGSDNLEVRVSWDGAGARARLRRLDATPPEGPEWLEAGELLPCLAVAASGDSSHWTVELTLDDWGLGELPARDGGRLGLRFDAGSRSQGDYAPYLPRLVAPVRLALQRASFAPEGFRFKPEFRGRSVVPGQSLPIRFTFEGSDDAGVARAEMRTEGLGEEDATLQAQPFPGFDRKGRAFVDYPMRVSPSAKLGYRVARCTLVRKSGDPIVCQASYQIAPIVTFDAVLPKALVSPQNPTKIKLPVYLRSHVMGRVDGVFDAVLPAGWEAGAGLGKRFIIPNARGSVRRVFDLTVPAGVRGVFPIRLKAEFDRGVSVEQTVWMSVL
ncbi:MAG: hypothetical protein N2109_02880 [Fimbriimonadales bacterium]|nr:hypothetical protein [Fimbriimonadales bacterium]